MPLLLSKPCTAFQDARRIAAGPLIDVALAVKAAMDAAPTASFLAFDDATGAVVDFDLRGTTAEIVARLAQRAEAARRANQSARRSEGDGARQGRGRPKLGVVAREVTLLPRHWDWLASQPGGASQVLRRLVDEARRGDGGRSEARAAKEAAYAFMSAMAGNFEGFEEAVRALFADDRTGLVEHARTWPPDIRSHAEALMTRAAPSPPGDPADASLS
ncbi:DUF2239 family protein [Bosea caraganae]|uniref:DUF2239 family protein n=1 Tax=Bosea caraganae TaxID=2763117 RepID=A0A370LB89_9HYPH|nr:DUF2239 family protein [Bosea caraganae]RDJ27217.1 DUF2239 family protein [Bosea caraganae]RDJ29234.1 DUF2239 family protein [Bosea caraganae]